MKPVTEVRDETAEVLGKAVAEVARRAIRPELEPFKDSLGSLAGKLEGHAEEFGEQVRAEKKALEGLNKQLGEVVTTGRSQASAAADTQARVQELRESLHTLAGELAATRDEQATTVAALNALRDEVLSWVRVSDEQTARLSSVLGRAEALNEVLGSQASAFSEFGDALSGQLDARLTEVLQGIGEVRAQGGREASDLMGVLGDRFKEQDTSSRSAACDLATKIDAGVKAITSTVASARHAGSSEVAALGAAHDARDEAAKAEVKALIEALRSELSAKVETGFLRAVERLESGNLRAADEVAGLRTTAEMRLASLQKELGTVLERLTAKHEDHGRELAKTGQTAGRVFRLTAANLVLVLVALAIGGIALWKASR